MALKDHFAYHTLWPSNPQLMIESHNIQTVLLWLFFMDKKAAAFSYIPFRTSRAVGLKLKHLWLSDPFSLDQ